MVCCPYVFRLTSLSEKPITTLACSISTCPRTPPTSCLRQVPAPVGSQCNPTAILPALPRSTPPRLTRVAEGGRAVNRAAYLVEGGGVNVGGTMVQGKHMAVRGGSWWWGVVGGGGICSLLRTARHSRDAQVLDAAMDCEFTVADVAAQILILQVVGEFETESRYCFSHHVVGPPDQRACCSARSIRHEHSG